MQSRSGYGQGRTEKVPGFGMAVAAREIACLVGNHHLVLGQCAHVKRLIGAGAGREHVSASIEKRFDQPLAQRGTVDAARRGHHLEPHPWVYLAVLEGGRELADVTKAPPG